ncbi:hypothetical protein SUGI_0694760 [Cryptomeria japonica]|nr:hypothetical protein SUGI_0694760 [Cryptomeria japonica]
MEVSIGMKVEVCSEEEGFEGAVFDGTIIAFGNDVHENHTFFFQYDRFITEDLNGEPLVEEVYLKNMRPIPPYKQMPIDCSPGFAVEALDTDCWWRGIILNKFISPFDGKELFQIYFPNTCTMKAYSKSDLCLAQEWIEGQWTQLQWDLQQIFL